MKNIIQKIRARRRLIGLLATLYLAFLVVFGPPFLARKHLLTWELNFQENVIRLSERIPSEEEFINALQWRGFEMWIRPENPINGNSTTYIDLDQNYTTYTEFLRSHERFQSAFSHDSEPHPRVAQWQYGFIVCTINYTIVWHLENEKITNISTGRDEYCL